MKFAHTFSFSRNVNFSYEILPALTNSQIPWRNCSTAAKSALPMTSAETTSPQELELQSQPPQRACAVYKAKGTPDDPTIRALFSVSIKGGSPAH